MGDRCGIDQDLALILVPRKASRIARQLLTALNTHNKKKLRLIAVDLSGPSRVPPTLVKPHAFLKQVGSISPATRAVKFMKQISTVVAAPGTIFMCRDPLPLSLEFDIKI